MPTTTAHTPTPLEQMNISVKGALAALTQNKQFPADITLAKNLLRDATTVQYIHAVNERAALVAALERLYQVYIGKDPMVNIGDFIQQTLALATGKES